MFWFTFWMLLAAVLQFCGTTASVALGVLCGLWLWDKALLRRGRKRRAQDPRTILVSKEEVPRARRRLPPPGEQ